MVKSLILHAEIKPCLGPPIAAENFPAPAPSMWSSQAVEVQLAENGALAQYGRKDRLKRAAGRPGGAGAAILGTIEIQWDIWDIDGWIDIYVSIF